MNYNHYSLLAILLYQMSFDIPCQTFTEVQANVNFRHFLYGNFHRSKKVCRVHFDGKLYKESLICKNLAIAAALEISLWC